MKSILYSLVIICCFSLVANAQVITTVPSSISSDVSAQTFTITASGLTPAAGTLVAEPPNKFVISTDGVSWNYSLNISYSGGSLPATTLYVMYGGPVGLGNTGSVNISGGGASANVCVCANMSTCPCAPTGINNVINSSFITISPNPASGVLSVSSSDKITSISVINFIGQVVYTQEYNSESVRVDIASLPAGVYFMKINGAEVRKFIKE